MAESNLNIADNRVFHANVASVVDSVLANEFQRYTGQALSEYELSVLKDYIVYYWEADLTLDDLCALVHDFVSDCYTYQPADYDTNTPESYTIRDWWKFPMATVRRSGDFVVTTYRGGTTKEYRPLSQGTESMEA